MAVYRSGNVCVHVFAFVTLSTSVRSVYCSISCLSMYDVVVNSSYSCFVASASHNRDLLFLFLFVCFFYNDRKENICVVIR